MQPTLKQRRSRIMYVAGRPRTQVSRRALLRGSVAGASVALGLPLLDVMLGDHGEAMADGSPIDTRFGVWFFGTGVHQHWAPPDTGDLVLPPWFAALEPHQDSVCIVSGLSCPHFNNFGINRHNVGFSGVLSGTLTKTGGTFTMDGPSIDQRVADHLETAPRRSIESAAKYSTAISWNGADSPNAPRRDPRVLYDELFGVSTDPTGSAEVGAYRHAYLSACMEDVRTLNARLGARDRMRIEEYLEGLKELDDEIDDVTSCEGVVPGLDSVDDDNVGELGAIVDLNLVHSKLIANALACGLTRVFSYSFTGPGSNPKFVQGISLPDNHHELGHDQHPELPNSVGYIMARFADTLQAFADIPEGSGTLLDSLGVLVATEVAWNHVFDDMPVIVAGRAGGRLVGGQHIRAGGKVGRAALTVAHAVGAPLDSFGSEGAGATEVIDAMLV